MEGNNKVTDKRSLSAIMEEQGGFPRLSNGRWQYPPRLINKTVGRYTIYEYKSSLYEFSILIEF